MGDFSSSCGHTQRLGWQHIALTVTLVSLGMTPAWGQSLTPLEVETEAHPLLLAEATPQHFNRVLFVNPLTGDDQQGEGSLRSPFRSITHAVQFAESNTVIFLGAGSYTERSGEQFPIVLPPGVSLVEDPAAEQGSIAIAGAVTQGTTAAAPRAVRTTQATATPPASQPTTRSAGRSQRTPSTAERPPVNITATVPVTRHSTNSAPRAASPDAGEALQGIPIPVIPPTRQERTSTPPAEVAFERQGRSPQGIPIPVPPPERPSADSAVGQTRTFGRPSTTTAPIEIPVPPPENPMPTRSASSGASPVSNVAYVTQTSAAPSGQYDLLPVPDPNAPLGNTGNLPRVPVASLTRSANVSQAIGGTVSRSSGALQYRVLVRAENEDMRDWVRSVVPDAFETVADGQTLMQIGAFQNLENAEEAADQLNRSGIRAIIEEWR